MKHALITRSGNSNKWKKGSIHKKRDDCWIARIVYIENNYWGHSDIVKVRNKAELKLVLASLNEGLKK